MSVNMKELNDRIASLQAYWRDRGIPTLRAHTIDPEGLAVRNEDPFGPIRLSTQMNESQMPDVMYQRVFEAITKLKENPEFPASMNNKGGIFDTMEDILKGTIRYKPIEREEQPMVHRHVHHAKPVRLTILNRKKHHDAFIIDDPKMTFDLNGFKRWLKEFYCKQYLKSDRNNTGKTRKADQILTMMELIPNEVRTIGEYLNTVVVNGEPTLAQLIGLNRISLRSGKAPWGAEMIKDTFSYVIEIGNISAKGTNLSKPLEIPEVEVNHFTGHMNIKDF